jgi:hypothetical protein
MTETSDTWDPGAVGATEIRFKAREASVYASYTYILVRPYWDILEILVCQARRIKETENCFYLYFM